MSELDRLRDARRSLASVAAGSCPSPEHLYDAATGALSPAEVARFVDHAGHCGACASDWALVRASLPAARSRAPWRRAAVALGTVVALAAAVILWVQTPPPGAPLGSAGGGPDARPLVFRALEVSGPTALIADGAALPRDAFRLAWVPGPAGTIYSVVVGDEAGRPIHRVGGLDTASVTIPATALAGLPDGAVVVWQVEEMRVDGSTRRSAAYTSIVR